jgi:site-specific recombinase XerD
VADPLSADDLDAFLVEEADSGLSESTVHARYRSIRAYLRWCSKRKKISARLDDLPTAIIDSPEISERKPKVADPVDVQRLLDSMTPAVTWLDYRDRAYVELLRSTGLRSQEACSLRVEHVNTREQYIFVLAGKGAKDRVVPFGAKFGTAFTGYRYNRPACNGDRLFISVECGDFTTDAARQMMQRRCAVAGTKAINLHSIRHMFAIESLNRGMQLSAVSACLGHSSLSFTARVYARWVLSGLRREYDEFVERV